MAPAPLMKPSRTLNAMPSIKRQQYKRRRQSVSELAFLAVVLLQMLGVCSAQYRYFYFPNFTSVTSYFNIQNSAKASGSVVWLLPNPNPSWRTGPNDTTTTWSGWMALNYPFSFVDVDPSTQQTRFQSFNTSFTFQFVTPGDEGDSPSGMAFFITPYGSSPAGGSNRFFGLSSTDTDVFAVEFDTRQSVNTSDPSGSHIGIDYGSVNSSAVVDTSRTNTQYYPRLYLYNNTAFKVWISYDSSSQLTKVWMTNNVNGYAGYYNPPADSVLAPILQYRYDLSNLFYSTSNQYMGFSAGTQSDSAMLGVVVYSWYIGFDAGAMPSPPPPPPPSPPPPPPPASFRRNPPPPPPVTTSSNSNIPFFVTGAAHSYTLDGLKAILSVLIGLIFGDILAP